MNTARFRVHSVMIEGFKGFTNPQTVKFAGKHCFLFGDNGLGKSSVVEAIRWCLFGLAERPETEVRNVDYRLGECQVELKLQSSDGVWQVRRRLRPGTTRSDMTIASPSGEQVLQSEVFPYLARMTPGEGTHIIFAAQQESGRRPQADISGFDKVLYSYLHLEEVPDLLKRLDALLEEQRVAQEQAASEIDDLEENLRDKLERVDLSLDELLRDPPWGGKTVPSINETNARVRRFIKEVSKLARRSIGGDGSPEEALREAEHCLEELASADRDEVQKKLDEERAKASCLKACWKTIEYAESKQSEVQRSIEKLQEALTGMLQGHSLEELESEIEGLRQQMTGIDAKLKIVRDAEKYCADHSAVECPVCQGPYATDDLLQRIRRRIEDATPEQATLAQKLDNLQERHQKALELSSELQKRGTEAHQAGQEHSDAMAQICSELGLPESEVTESTLDSQLATVEEMAKTLEDKLRSGESGSHQWTTRTENLRRELRFQEYRREQQHLQRQLTSGLEPIKQHHDELVTLFTTVDDLKEALEDAFNAAVDRAVPHLSSMMSDVFRRLTGQVSFEEVHVQRVSNSGRRDLHIRVGTSRKPDNFFDPEDVLNGQANSALRLVPYFVFSQFQAEALELDLLLIDDPSQSFDTSHVELLLEELAKAGSHAQLVIATHEEERFTPHIGQYWPKGEYEVIKVTGFDPQRGPSFATQ